MKGKGEKEKMDMLYVDGWWKGVGEKERSVFWLFGKKDEMELYWLKII